MSTIPYTKRLSYACPAVAGQLIFCVISNYLLYFYTDVSAGPLRRANALRGLRWAGIDIGDRQAVIWGFHLDRPFRERFAAAVKDYFNNMRYFSSFDMSEETMEQYAKSMASPPMKST